ncbi:MAG: outer membrane lipoprotein chaperone LolA [Leptothrix sp. (in: b-proteobacteria)]
MTSLRTTLALNPTRRTLAAALLGLAAWAMPGLARADAVAALREFVQSVQSGRASFSQVVTAPDGAKKKASAGSFEFLRPNRFRFDYSKPYEQQIVADGAKVWLFDVDLNQVTVRPFDQALGSTPAALLAGTSIERDFTLSNAPDDGGLQWALAQPKAKEGSIRSLRVGFRGKDLAAFEITDAFGQRSRLDFGRFEANATVPAARFKFIAPAGADVLQQ